MDMINDLHTVYIQFISIHKLLLLMNINGRGGGNRTRARLFL
jgi:hypothetical protein